jgi:hypothetical protein
MQAIDPAFQDMLTRLVATLREEARQNQRLLNVVRRKKEHLLGGRHEEMENLLRAEKEALTDVVTMERDRVELMAELGQSIGHPHPTRLRIAELVLHADPENRDELLDLREEFRDLADEMDDLVAVEPIFTRHRQDNVRLYVSPSRWKRFNEESPKSGARQAAGSGTSKSEKAEKLR